MQTTASGPKTKAAIHEQEALKKRAAKQAAKRELAPDTVEQVECTVLPLGDGHISMGQHIAGLGEAHYEEGEAFTCDLPIAIQHYVRGWVQFPGAREALKDAELQGEHRKAADAASKAALDKLMDSIGR
jgi:hypothetical protein